MAHAAGGFFMPGRSRWVRRGTCVPHTGIIGGIGAGLWHKKPRPFLGRSTERRPPSIARVFDAIRRRRYTNRLFANA
jgi:hypothetical protein